MASVRLIQNIGLGDAATSQQTSTINEPTAAASGNNIFVTGNWFASRSTTGGANFALVDPFTALPSAAGGFCCDQAVIYDPTRDIWIWILQYIRSGGNNIFRVAISRGTSFGSWYWWDFSPRALNATWTDMWFDYPDAALSTNHLYITFNAFNAAGNWLRAFVFKLPLDQLRNGSNLGYQWWSTTTNGSLRLTRGAGNTMFFASHNGTSTLRVYSWPDGSGTLGSFDVNVGAYSRGPYSAPGPGGVEWLGRIDSRITGAWLTGTRAGFMWTAAAGFGRPLPHVRVAVVDTVTRSLTGQPDIWNSSFAYAYPSACPNAQGVVGVSLFFGGGTRHPAHVVGFRDGDAWRLVITRSSTHGPTNGAWGDYLWCLRHQPQASEWVASGYTLQGGTDRRNVEPQYVHFGIGS
jgi:hypothetical protein